MRERRRLERILASGREINDDARLQSRSEEPLITFAELVRLMRESVRGSWLLSDVRNKTAWLDPKTSIAPAVGVISQGDEWMTTHIHGARTRQPLREIIERAEAAGTSS